MDANDDLGSAKAPLKVVACMAVKGRGPLLQLTIRRLYSGNGVHKVICVGDEPEDRQICEESGAVWVQYCNKPLGDKWNQAFAEAKKYNPDACLYVGSSDWLSYNWIDRLTPHLRSHHLVGVPFCHFLDIGETTNRLVFWPGYNPALRVESIGAGRLLSHELMEAIKWKPFDPFKDSSLDRSMITTCQRVKYKEFIVKDEPVMVVSISTWMWSNKHRFDDH